MPSEEDENEQSNLLELCITKDCLLQELRSNPSRLIILDCRSSDEFGESHIRNAVNFSIPSIMLRRLAAGKIDLTSTIKCRDLKEKIVNGYKENLFVIYSDAYITDKLFHKNSFTAGDTIHVLAKRLLKDGCRVVCLEDGFGGFRTSYPEWCESCSDTAATSESERDPSNMAMPLMGLRSLRISAWRSSGNRSLGGGESSGTFSADESSLSDSADEGVEGGGGGGDDAFPVQILPHLYLGNHANSVDADALDKYGIQYILNVTPDLPNVFEERIKYMNIPITDHWSQNLASFFPKAIEFIDEARGQNKGVLVHCLAGVSRSVTVTVAYLMARHHLSLNDAFCLVRARKSNIAPNFHFMEQLHTFERQLNDGANAQPHSANRSPAAVRCLACGLVDAADTCRKCCDRVGDSGGGRGRLPSQPPPSTTSSSSSATFLSPSSLSLIGQSPDSGIEFDRWTTPSETTPRSSGPQGDDASSGP